MSTTERAPNDSRLLSQIAQRDLRSLEQFYDRHAEVVYGLILYIVQDKALADELLQETFLQVWATAGSVESERDAVLWLYQLARRRCLDALRWSLQDAQKQMALTERIREHAQMLSRDNGSIGSPATVLFDFTDSRTQSQRDLTWRAFQMMPEEQRACLSLAFFAGMTDQEIANYIHFPLPRIRTFISDGVNRLGSAAQAAPEERKERV